MSDIQPEDVTYAPSGHFVGRLVESMVDTVKATGRSFIRVTHEGGRFTTSVVLPVVVPRADGSVLNLQKDDLVVFYREPTGTLILWALVESLITPDNEYGPESGGTVPVPAKKPPLSITRPGPGMEIITTADTTLMRYTREGSGPVWLVFSPERSAWVAPGDLGFRSGAEVNIESADATNIKATELNVDAPVTKLGGDTKHLVTWEDLNTALGLFKTSIDTAIASAIVGHMHATATPGPPSPGVGTASPTTVDIALAKATKVKTG